MASVIYIYLFYMCVFVEKRILLVYFFKALECCVRFCTAQPPHGPFQAQQGFLGIRERNP